MRELRGPRLDVSEPFTALVDRLEPPAVRISLGGPPRCSRYHLELLANLVSSVGCWSTCSIEGLSYCVTVWRSAQAAYEAASAGVYFPVNFDTFLHLPSSGSV